MAKNWKDQILAKNTWIRGLFMVLFVIVNYFVRLLILMIAIVQFIVTLIIGKPMERLVSFGSSISQYSYQILLFITFNTEKKPFPFTDWPVAKQASPKLPSTKKK